MTARHRRAPPTPRWDRWLCQLPLIAVFVVGLGGLLAVWLQYWRKGLYVLGLAVALAAVLRLLLPERRAGLLAVRTRWIDVAVLGALGLAVLVLATVIPPVPLDGSG